MKIKTKLFASTGLLLSGVAIIAVASAIALQGIEASVHKLTDESAPLQLKTLELQQTIEKLSANFFKLGLSGDRRQAEELSTTIDGQIAAIGGLKDQIESLQKGGVEAADTAGFREIHSAVKQAVQQRLQDTQVFSAEAANVDQVLKSIAGSIDAIKGGLDGLGAQAATVVAQAQQSDLASNNSIQKLGDLRAHVKDLIIIVGDIGTVANRYRLEPLRERLTAVGEAVHAIHAEEGDPAVVKEVQDAVAQVSEQMTRDGDGLLALRAQVLASKDAEPQYLSLKGGIVDALDGLNAKMLQAIDPLELRLVEDRKKLETAYGFMESAARIKDASSAVNSDVKELNTELRLVMLSNSGEELDRIVADSQRLAARARTNVEAMKKGVLQARQPKLAADADAIGAQLRNVDAAGAKIVAAKRSVLASDVALQQIIERVKASSRRQESSSAQQVQSIGDHQREVVALVRASVNRSFVIILAVSLALFAGGIVISTRIGLSITRPLSRLSQTLVAAAHSGDFTARVAESGRDEVSQAVRAFNQLMQSLQAALGDTNRVIAALAQGDFSRRIEAQVSGDLEVLKNGVNASLDQVQATMATLARAMAALADGKLDARIDAQATGEFRHLLQQAAQTVQAVQQMANDVRALVQAGSEGRLDARADAGRHQGDYRRLVESINALLDAVAAPVTEVTGVLAALARGDLQQQMSGRYAGTFGQLRDDADSTVAQLRRMVSGIREATDAINVAAREIAAGNADLSNRTEVQAASLEHTASSMGRLTEMVKQNTDHAQRANELAAGAAEVALKGGAMVGQLVATMKAISGSADHIVGIIAMIDGIAFQTNILALNAAVEAARAGEQGRGFAVVASEVRSLAQRAAAAAREIKGLIESSVNEVGTGSRLVKEAGGTMEAIVGAVGQVRTIMGEITTASSQQYQGIQQVTQAVAEMDRTTQQNAALVEEAAGSAEMLAGQAEGLARSVAVFKMRQEPAAAPRQAPARPAAAQARR